jgi:hypothetical protein
VTSDRLKSEKEAQKHERAQKFAAQLSATGLRLLEFAKAAGFTRNVIYNLSIGQAPSTNEQAERLAAAFERLKQ